MKLLIQSSFARSVLSLLQVNRLSQNYVILALLDDSQTELLICDDGRGPPVNIWFVIASSPSLQDDLLETYQGCFPRGIVVSKRKLFWFNIQWDYLFTAADSKSFFSSYEIIQIARKTSIQE